MTGAARARVRAMMVIGSFTAAVGGCLLLQVGNAPVHAAQKDDAWPKLADPLFPKDKGDVSTGYAACAACHANTLPINEKINVFAKNFKSHHFVLLSEGGTWITEDPHSAAHRVLSQPLGQQMSKILKYDVTKAPQCLTCHAIDRYPGMAITKETDVSQRFDTSEGVTCNACHGVRKAWQGEHFADQNKTIPWRTKTPEYKEQHGMRNLRDPVVKAQLCASCHVGDPSLNRVVTHDMYAAGHPPLPPFELGTFMENEPKHWGYPTDPQLKFFTDEGFKEFTKQDTVPENWKWNLYRFHPAEKEVYLARQIAAGAVASLHAEMKLITADAASVAMGNEGIVDFARFDCYACHHDLKIPSPRQQRGYAGAPGRPPLKAWTAALPSVVVAHAENIKQFAGVTKDFDTRWDAVQSAALAKPFGKPKELAEAAKMMAAWCEEFMKAQQKETAPVYSPEEAKKLVSMIGNAAVSEKWIGDPEAAMHLTWAYVTLRDHMGNPIPKEKLDALGKVVPVRVRQPRELKDGKTTYSDPEGNPITVSSTLRKRLDLFNQFSADNYKETFGGIVGGGKK